jgi:hypothetical protein
LRRRDMNLSHGDKWKTPISKYISGIAPSGNAPCTAEHRMAG